jgi:drug/metabolite transporter (DMT)-like permease
MVVRKATSYSGLVAGIAAVSFAATLIRLADAPAPVVAALRMIFTSLVLTPLAMRSRHRRRAVGTLSRKDLYLIVLAGVLLSLHFIFWISSLSLTGVASSVVFVTTSPLFVAFYSVLVLKERVSRIFWGGLAIAVVGGAILGGNDLLLGGSKWRGDILALLGAVAAAGYYLVGSRQRGRMELIAYVFPVYTVAAVMLAIMLLVLRIPLAGYGFRTYLYCFLMALVCQVIGHSLFNWALRHLKATVVTIGVVGEPVGASILAFLILGEVPLVTEIVGGGIIITGIVLVLYYHPDVTRSEL